MGDVCIDHVQLHSMCTSATQHGFVHVLCHRFLDDMNMS